MTVWKFENLKIWKEKNFVFSFRLDKILNTSQAVLDYISFVCLSV